MKEDIFKVTNSEGIDLCVYKWMPEEKNIEGVIQIAHGMAEWAYRYKYFAQKLCERGYVVYAHDHRGHGKTATNEKELGYVADKDGFNCMVNDIFEINKLIKTQYEDCPIVLFGHSMGSFLAQRYVQVYGESINGLILCGSNGPMGGVLNFGIILSGIIMKFKGKKYKSSILANLSFKGFNDKFKPIRTGSEWLSKNEKNIDEYIKDPYCGFVCTTSFYYDFYKGLKEREQDINVEKVPKSMPIFIISGAMDPVGDYSAGVNRLYDMYKKVGISNLEKKLYEGLRHEILNENNKDEVIKDILQWVVYNM